MKPRTCRASVNIGLALLVCSAVGGQAHAQVSLDEGLQQMASDLASTLEGSEIRKIAVVEFHDINGYPSALGPFIVEELVTQLFTVRPGRFEIVERRQLARVLNEQQLTSSGLFDEDSIAAIGKILGIQAIVTGSIADLGTSVRINTRAISVETARVFAAASATVARDETVQNLLRQAASPGAREPVGGSQPTSQPADVYFQNDFLRVSVASIGVSKEERGSEIRVTLSLVFENLTNADLLIADTESCTLRLIDDRGTLYDISELAGLSCVYPDLPGMGPEHYSSLGPNSRTTVVAQFRGSAEIIGSTFAFAGNLVRHRNGKYSQFSVGISGIQHGKS